MTCNDCNFRKELARRFDIHIDWRDCWKQDCEYRELKEGYTDDIKNKD